MPRGRVHDRELLDALEALGGEAYRGDTWRTAWASRHALTGDGGGRWHPPDGFEALYTSLEADGALVEVYYHLSKAPVFSSAAMRINRLRVETERTLRLDRGDLARLGIDAAAFQSMDYARSQEIGAAAYLLEFDSLMVPSARGPSLNLVLFLDRLDPDRLQVIETLDVNWPAWKEKRGRT